MNDRFKFRAWYKPLFDEESPHYVYDVEQIYDGFTNKGHCELGWVSSFGEILNGRDEYIVEQCTGLKDKNGKQIYEGDIVTRSLKIYRVDWCEDKLGFVLRRESNPDDILESLDITIKTWEIIGNIHENADLLEVEND